MPAFSTHYLFARELMEQIEAMTPETRLDPAHKGRTCFFFIGFCPRCRGKVATRPARECTVQIPTFFLKRCFGMLRRCLRLGGIRPYPIFMDFCATMRSIELRIPIFMQHNTGSSRHAIFGISKALSTIKWNMRLIC